jgi:hypothetical protein
MKKYPFLVVLLAIYPGLALLTWNFREVDAKIVIRPFLFSITFSLIVLAISFLLIKSRPRAILISTVFIFFFLTSGHISILFEGSAFAAALGGLSRFLNLFLYAIALLILASMSGSTVLTEKRSWGPANVPESLSATGWYNFMPRGGRKPRFILDHVIASLAEAKRSQAR